MTDLDREAIHQDLADILATWVTPLEGQVLIGSASEISHLVEQSLTLLDALDTSEAEVAANAETLAYLQARVNQALEWRDPEYNPANGASDWAQGVDYARRCIRKILL